MYHIKTKHPLIILITCAALSGCAKDGSMARWSKCALAGAGAGGLLGAIDSAATAGWSALGGAVIGGTICAFIDNDKDKDGVHNKKDACPNTPEGVEVDSKGCPVDRDNDGVPDYLDKCPGTPMGMRVNAEGCHDSDGDGVPDNLDQCPNTPAGAKVDVFGCTIDSDGDGISDGIDQCPDTPAGVSVDARGCPLNSDLGTIYFDFDKAVLSSEAKKTLDAAAETIKHESNTLIKVTGFTDDKGVESYNNKLAKRRADAAQKYLEQQGIALGRIEPVSGGVSRQGNASKQSRHLNRRVDIMVVR